MNNAIKHINAGGVACNGVACGGELMVMVVVVLLVLLEVVCWLCCLWCVSMGKVMILVPHKILTSTHKAPP
jgi:hypothetical protein